MYLIITEDGELSTQNHLSDEDLENCMDGAIRVVQFSAGRFQELQVDSDEIEEDGETVTEYTETWILV